MRWLKWAGFFGLFMLVACIPRVPPTGTLSPSLASTPRFSQTPILIPTPTPTFTPVPTLTPTPAPSPLATTPEEAIRGYWENLKQKKYDKAFEYLSAYSVRFFGLDKARFIQIAREQEFKGWELEDYFISDTIVKDNEAWVKVLTREREGGKVSTYEFWDYAIKEGREWRRNHGGLIAYFDYSKASQVRNNVLVEVKRVTIYTQKVVMEWVVDNPLDYDVALGWPATDGRLESDSGDVLLLSGEHLVTKAHTRTNWTTTFKKTLKGKPRKFTLSNVTSLDANGLPRTPYHYWNYEIVLEE